MTSAAAEPAGPSVPLPPGTRAPDFSLLVTPDDYLTLSDIGAPVVLIFYPADWSPVCGDELSVFETARGLFEEQGLSCSGSRWTASGATALSKPSRKLEFPLLADFHPQGEVSKAYGVYRADDGTADRGLFVLGQRTHDHVELPLADRDLTRCRRRADRCGGAVVTEEREPARRPGHAPTTTPAARRTPR